MANKDIEVKTGGAPAAWRSFRDELDRVFERFNQSLALPFLGGLSNLTAAKLPPWTLPRMIRLIP